VDSAKSDHLAALFFSPLVEASHGIYTPGRFDLHLSGKETLVDHLIHHHEAQHVLLTASTAWGAALHVAARVPQWVQSFNDLLRLCRLTHESYATYLSCSLVASHLGSPGLALASYPDYVPLVERLDRFVSTVPGEHRRSLAVTALVRVCMQTPILADLVTSWPEPFTPGAVRARDTPDERLSLLLRAAGALPTEVVTAADAIVAAEFGPDPLAADRASGVDALDDRFDAAWARWEQTIFTAFADRLTEAGATVIEGNEHIPVAAELVALARSTVPDVGVTVTPDPDVADDRVIPIILSHARVWLSTARRPARLITVRHNVDLAEVVRVAEATTRVGGRPNLVAAARLPRRLLAGYELPADERRVLESQDGPVVVVRTIADDGTDTETDAVWMVRLGEPADVAELAGAWQGRGDLAFCIAASCLADARWRDRWLLTLHDTGPIVWLIDVSIGSLAQEFGSGRTVHSIYLELGPTPTGVRHGVAFKVLGVSGVWLAVADEVSVQLVTRQVADLPGIDLHTTGADWSDLMPMIRRVLLDLLRTESYVDLRAFADLTG
jgi:hypothetical protein